MRTVKRRASRENSAKVLFAFDLLASLVEPGTRPTQLVEAMMARWAERQSEERVSGDRFDEFRLVLAAVRV
jgi:hypothetical protein